MRHKSELNPREQVARPLSLPVLELEKEEAVEQSFVFGHTDAGKGEAGGFVNHSDHDLLPHIKQVVGSELYYAALAQVQEEHGPHVTEELLGEETQRINYQLLPLFLHVVDSDQWAKLKLLLEDSVMGRRKRKIPQGVPPPRPVSSKSKREVEKDAANKLLVDRPRRGEARQESERWDPSKYSNPEADAMRAELVRYAAMDKDEMIAEVTLKCAHQL